MASTVFYRGGGYSANDIPYNSNNSVKDAINTAKNNCLWNRSEKETFETSFSDFDTWMNNSSIKTATNKIITIDNYNSLTVGGYGCGNHQYILAWINTEKTYGWVMIFNFYRLIYGKRAGSTTTTWTNITSGW